MHRKYAAKPKMQYVSNLELSGWKVISVKNISHMTFGFLLAWCWSARF